MGKKMLLNTLYSIVIIVSLIIGYQYGIEQKMYGYIAGAVIIIAIFIVLKVRLLKAIRQTQKP
jgi:hypothetical protein